MIKSLSGLCIVELADVRTSSDGKSGLEVLMLIIEKSLLPSVDESQRILAGPLIADLVRKVRPTKLFLRLGECGNPTSFADTIKCYHRTITRRNKTRFHTGTLCLRCTNDSL